MCQIQAYLSKTKEDMVFNIKGICSSFPNPSLSILSKFYTNSYQREIYGYYKKTLFTKSNYLFGFLFYLANTSSLKTNCTYHPWKTSLEKTYPQ